MDVDRFSVRCFTSLYRLAAAIFVRGPLRLDNQRICGRRSLTGDVHGAAGGPVADPRLARGSATLIFKPLPKGGPKMTDRSPAVRVATIVGSVVVLLLLVALVIALLFGPLLQGGSHYG